MSFFASAKNGSLSIWRKFLAKQLRWHNSAKNTQKNVEIICDQPKDNVTILESGLRVAGQQSYGQFCTIGVAISAGPRNEVFYPPGTTHFVEKIAFSSSLNFPDKEYTMDLLENCGALVDCQSTRDTFLYASSCRKDIALDVLRVIADTVLRPNVWDEEIEFCRHVIRYENDALAKQPECEPLLTDWIHQAAFRSNTIGLSRYCPSESVEAVSSAHVISFLSQYYAPSRIVLAGVGLDQKWLADAAKELFNPHQTTWHLKQDRLLKQMPSLDNSLSQYTGGDVRIERDLSQMALGPTPFPNLAHMVIGFRGVGVGHDDFVPFCVLQSLMGGGGSFSAGGPGKGMFTRLYVDVLNRHHWIYNATAYNHSYSDAGLFCIRASVDPSKMQKLAKVVVDEFRRLRKGVGKEELERAKVQLKSQLLMNLEMRPVQFEDLARQVLAHGERKTAEEYAQKIDQVQNGDIVRIARYMLDTSPSVVGYGDLREMPTYEQIQSML